MAQFIRRRRAMNGKELVEAIQKIPDWENKLVVEMWWDSHFGACQSELACKVRESGEDEFTISTEDVAF